MHILNFDIFKMIDFAKHFAKVSACVRKYFNEWLNQLILILFSEIVITIFISLENLLGNFTKDLSFPESIVVNLSILWEPLLIILMK